MLTLVRLEISQYVNVLGIKISPILQFLVVGSGLFIGLIFSWIYGLSGGDVFIWIFCLYLGLEVGQLIFADDSNDDDDDFDGGILTPVYQGI